MNDENAVEREMGWIMGGVLNRNRQKLRESVVEFALLRGRWEGGERGKRETEERGRDSKPS